MGKAWNTKNNMKLKSGQLSILGLFELAHLKREMTNNSFYNHLQNIPLHGVRIGWEGAGKGGVS